MFHVSDGLYFDRLADGSVRICKKCGNVNVFDQNIDSNAWASIISSVSKGGEADLRYFAAKDFHNSEGQIKLEKV